VGKIAGDNLLEIELNDQERRAVGRVLAERRALLIETTEDTTQPDSARHAGSIELSVIESILAKLCLRDVASSAASAKRLGRRNESESFPDPRKPSGRVLWRLRRRYHLARVLERF
jgi:hypothetical protein